MTKSEQVRLWAWRVRVIREAASRPRNIAPTCRRFGISRQAYYRWKRRFDAQVRPVCGTGPAGRIDRPRRRRVRWSARFCTALINEAYIRLVAWKSVDWQDRAHFFAVAAKMMRRMLVSHAVSRGRQKRGAQVVVVPLEEAGAVAAGRTADIVALDEVLSKLAKFDERKSQLVELRFFAGLTETEAAEVLNICPCAPCSANGAWHARGSSAN